MVEFDRLLEIADRLLGPNGCPWDREQTYFTLQPYLVEEVYELIEAIDLLDSEKILEELGDVLYTLVFIAKLAEAEGRFKISDAIEAMSTKLIRRHPHVFGETKVSSTEEVLENWEKIKKTEKAHEKRKGLFDGIPPKLPALPRAQKMAKILMRKGASLGKENVEVQTEEDLGNQLWDLIAAAERKGFDAENALRRTLVNFFVLE